MPIKFEYIEFGNKKNPTLLFLHGFMGNAWDFFPIMTKLSRELHCVSISLAYHGATKLEINYSFEDIITELAIFISTHLDKKISLCGYSLGGRTALYLAIRFPNLFEKIILESASPGLRSSEERDARIQSDSLLANRILNEDMEDFLKSWYSNPLFGDIRNNQNFPALLKKRLNNQKEDLIKSLEVLGTGMQPSFWNELKNIDKPSLIIVGKSDEKYYNIAQEMCKEIKSAKLITIENAAHNAHFEKEEEFINHIQKFILEK